MRKNSRNESVMRGDGLKVFLESNDQILEVLGDGCRLKVVNNTGKIRMIGDGSRVEITGKIGGEIEYRGDGGRIVLGPEVILKSLVYSGDEGQVGRQSHTSNKSEILEKCQGIGFCTTSRLKKRIFTPD